MKAATLQRPASLVAEVCRQLSALIRERSGDAEPWLPAERSLAERLGVSRSVVREATKRLEQQGLLEVQHGNGIRIVDQLHRPLNGSLERLIPDEAERLRELHETRLAIEPVTAQLAATRAREPQLQALREIHARLIAAPDTATAIEIDLAFHHALAEAGGNRIFRLILDSLGDIGRASRLRTIGRVGKQSAIDQHAKVLAALERRDPAAAGLAMREHLLAAGEDMDLGSLIHGQHKRPAPAKR